MAAWDYGREFIADMYDGPDLVPGEEDSDEEEDEQEEQVADEQEHEADRPVEPDRYKHLDRWVVNSKPAGFPHVAPLAEEPGFRAGVWENRPFKHESPGQPIEYHFVWWKGQWYGEISDNTNDFVECLIEANIVKREDWTATTADEIMAFHGVVMRMGVLKHVGGVAAYFDKKYGDEWVKSSGFTERRFMQLLKYLHVVSPDAEHDDPTDPTNKVKLWYARVTNHAIEIWAPDKEIGIDETMNKNTSRRCPVRVVIKGKPIPAGSKVWSAVDRLGVVIYIKMYAGARRQNGRVEHGLATSVVRDILATLRCTGHWIFTDNFYGNFDTLDACIEAGQECVLMIRRPRKLKAGSEAGNEDIVRFLCEALGAKGVNRGAKLAAYYEDRCMAVAWKDNKVVPILTTVCADDKDVHVRRSATGGVIQIPCTEAVMLYNLYKSIVDRWNAKKAEADVITKPRRWWVRPFTNCVWTVAENNAWRSSVWHNITRGAAQRPFWVFRMQCADFLILPFKESRQPPTLPLVHAGHNLRIRDVFPGRKPSRCEFCRVNSTCGFICTVCLRVMHWKCARQHTMCSSAIK